MLFTLNLFACQPSVDAIQTAIAETEAAKPTITDTATPAHTDTLTPSLTFTFTPSFTPSSTFTPTYTITPSPTATNTHLPETATAEAMFATQTQKAANTTSTAEARLATQTQQAKNLTATRAEYEARVQATQDVRDKITHWKDLCPKIDWRELAETEYAKDHLGECVSVSGRIAEVNLSEYLIDIWLGSYSADLIIGTRKLNNREGRLTEGQWITVYGHVRFGEYIRTNQLTGKVTQVASIDALLIEGSGSVVWVRK